MLKKIKALLEDGKLAKNIDLEDEDEAAAELSDWDV